MSLGFIFLFILFIADALASNLWKDSHDAVLDVTRLYNGENLLYFTHGSMKFNTETVANITQFFEIAARNVFCFGLADIGRPSVINEKLGTSTEPKLVVLHDIHALDDSNRKSLDIIFRFTDSTGEYKNTILVFVDDSLVSSSSAPFTELSWKEVLGEKFNSDAMFINGNALVGRITRAAIEDAANTSPSLETSSGWCEALNTRRLISEVSVESPVNGPSFNWFSILTMFAVPASIYLMYRNFKGSSPSTAELPTTNKPDEFRGGSCSSGNALKSIKIVSCSSAASLNSVARGNDVSTPVATPPAASFDGELFRSQYHNNREGRSGSSYYGEGSLNSADKAAAVSRLHLMEETMSVASSADGRQSRRRSGSGGSSTKRPHSIFNVGSSGGSSSGSTLHRLSFGEQSLLGSTPGSTVTMKEDVLAVAAAHNALFSLPHTRLASSPEEEENEGDLSPSPAAAKVGGDSPSPQRDINKIHVTIDETSAPVRIRGRRKTAPSSQQQQEDHSLSPPLGSRRVTRSQDMTTRSGTVLNAGGSGVRRGRARSDSSNKRASTRLMDDL